MESRKKDEGKKSAEELNQDNLYTRLAKFGVSEEEIPNMFRSTLSPEYEFLANTFEQIGPAPDHAVNQKDFELLAHNKGKPKEAWLNPITSLPHIMTSQINLAEEKLRLNQLEQSKAELEKQITSTKGNISRVEVYNQLANDMATFENYRKKIYDHLDDIKKTKHAFNKTIGSLKIQIEEANKRKQFLHSCGIFYKQIAFERLLKQQALLFSTLQLSALLNDFMKFTSHLINKDYADHPLIEIDETKRVLEKSIILSRQLDKKLKKIQTNLLKLDADEILEELEYKDTLDPDDEERLIKRNYGKEEIEKKKTNIPTFLTTITSEKNKKLLNSPNYNLLFSSSFPNKKASEDTKQHELEKAPGLNN